MYVISCLYICLFFTINQYTSSFFYKLMCSMRFLLLLLFAFTVVYDVLMLLLFLLLMLVLFLFSFVCHLR